MSPLVGSLVRLHLALQVVLPALGSVGLLMVYGTDIVGKLVMFGWLPVVVFGAERHVRDGVGGRRRGGVVRADRRHRQYAGLDLVRPRRMLMARARRAAASGS